MVASIVGAGISALGSIGGALASNALSTYEMQQMAKYQAALNYKYAKKSALNMPTYNRQGIENAGYNPMLALGNLQGATSNWSSLANPTTPDLSTAGSNAVNTALAIKQQENQNITTDAQVKNTNADTVFKNSQAITETFKQMNLQVDSLLKERESQLRDLDISNYERKQIRADIDTYTNYKRMLNDYELGVQSNAINSMNAVTNRLGTEGQISIGSTNAQTEKERLKWDKTKFGIGAGIAGVGSMFIPGIGLLRNTAKAKQVFNALHFIGK